MTFLSRAIPRVAAATFWAASVICVNAAAFEALPLIQTEENSAALHITNARAAFLAKKYGKAKDEAKRAIALNKESPEAYLLLAMVYWREGKWDDSVRYDKEALKYSPDYTDAHYLMGLLHLQNRKFDEARKEAELVISKGNRASNAYLLLAQANLARSKPEEALEPFQNALRLTPPGTDDAMRLTAKIEALQGWIESRADIVNPSFVHPRPLNTPVPSYTDEARAAKVRGTVHMVVLVSVDGKVSSTLVLVGLGFGLDEEAVTAARRLKFTPATKEGKPVAFWLRIDVEFNLQ
jgi:TonB family protein